jgi:hypothetical protein
MLGNELGSSKSEITMSMDTGCILVRFTRFERPVLSTLRIFKEPLIDPVATMPCQSRITLVASHSLNFWPKTRSPAEKNTHFKPVIDLSIESGVSPLRRTFQFIVSRTWVYVLESGHQKLQSPAHFLLDWHKDLNCNVFRS